MNNERHKPKTARRRPAASPARLPQPDATADHAVQALRRFRQIFSAVRTHFQQVERITGIGAAQLRGLSLLRERPGLRVSELAQAMDIHQSTASNLVKLLVARKMLAAARDGADGRVLRLHLLPAGDEILQRLQGHYIGVLPQALQSLQPRLLKRLNTDLDVLIAAMRTDARAALSPLASL